MKKSFRTSLVLIAAFGGLLALAQDAPEAAPDRDPQPPPGAPDAPPRPPRPSGDPGRRFDQPPGDSAPPGEGRRPYLRRPQFDRPDGAPGEDRRDDPAGSREGRRDPFGDQSIPTKPQPFLGVVTEPLDPALSAQIGMTEGLGLIVNHILPDSPAAKAGLQEHDIIKQINDQLIADPDQLATLVRHYGKDVEVTLTIIRKGQEQKMTAKIGEHQVPERRSLRSGGFGNFPGFPSFERNVENFQRRVENWRRDGQDPSRNWINRFPPPRSSADVLRDVAPGGPDVKVERDQVRTRWNTSNARIVLKDEAGEIEVTSENGKRTLVAKDAKGETVFNGPIDTEEQRKSVPEMFRKKLETAMRIPDERPVDTPQQRPNRDRIESERPVPAPAPEPLPPRRAPQVQ